MPEPPSALIDLPTPARYFPIRGGRYDVAPNLTRLAQAAFGNGDCDTQVFQFDRDFPRYRANKMTARREQFDKYVLTDNLGEAVATAAARRILALLTAEHPHLFAPKETRHGLSLACHLTGETLHFDREMRLLKGDARGYHGALDALLCQVPEDLAIVVRAPDRADRIAALHVCAPSHWSPAEKIGLPFSRTHAPVPGMERIRERAAPGIVAAMIDGPPTVRFTWGIEFDDRLNHHPTPPPDWSAVNWNCRIFDPTREPTPLILRVERQVTVGLPEVDAALFAIRVYCYDGREVRADAEKRDALVAALRSMSAESRVYKSLGGGCLEEVVRWLEESLTPGPSPHARSSLRGEGSSSSSLPPPEEAAHNYKTPLSP